MDKDFGILSVSSATQSNEYVWQRQNISNLLVLFRILTEMYVCVPQSVFRIVGTSVVC